MSDAALKKYLEFHQLEPNGFGDFDHRFAIPERVRVAGTADYVLYRSGKRDPDTGRKPKKPIDYIHGHGRGVHVYFADMRKRGQAKSVPTTISAVKTLVLLGECQGFAYVDDAGDAWDVPLSKPFELYTIPSGRALVITEGKRRVYSMIWGGRLGVERRGIVG